MKFIARTLFLSIAVFMSVNLCAEKNKKVEYPWIKKHEAKVYQKLPYRILKPIDFNTSKKYPVIIYLHGGGGRGNDNVTQMNKTILHLSKDEIRKQYPAYLLSPQSKSMWAKDQLQKLKEIIKTLKNVDRSRIYLIGYSMGGHGTFRFLMEDHNYFAAAITIAGAGLKKTEPFIDTELLSDFPIWSFHGEKDTVSPYSKGKALFEDFKKSRGLMKFTMYKGQGHNVPNAFLKIKENQVTDFSSDKCDKEEDALKWLFKRENNSL
jgi:predicted peptidase